MQKYLVICYAVHERKIASCDPFDTYGQAKTFLVKDAKNTYSEEYDNSSEEDRKFIELTICDAGIARLSSCKEEYIWTWEIVEIEAN